MFLTSMENISTQMTELKYKQQNNNNGSSL